MEQNNPLHKAFEDLEQDMKYPEFFLELNELYVPGGPKKLYLVTYSVIVDFNTKKRAINTVLILAANKADINRQITSRHRRASAEKFGWSLMNCKLATEEEIDHIKFASVVWRERHTKLISDAKAKLQAEFEQKNIDKQKRLLTQHIQLEKIRTQRPSKDKVKKPHELTLEEIAYHMETLATVIQHRGQDPKIEAQYEKLKKRYNELKTQYNSQITPNNKENTQ